MVRNTVDPPPRPRRLLTGPMPPRPNETPEQFRDRLWQHHQARIARLERRRNRLFTAALAFALLALLAGVL